MTIEFELGRRQVVTGAAATTAIGALSVLGARGAAASAPSTLARPVAATSYPVLKYGASGPAVLTLQRKLSALGYWLGSPDSSFGGLTQQAVYALQKYHGLARDGVCGPNTWAALNRNVRPVARNGSGYRVEINKAKQLLFIQWGTSVALTLNTSTGANKPFSAFGHTYNGQTPSGNFKVYRAVTSGWTTNELGSLYKPYFFNGGIAVHGSNSIPPYNASHGCCRLSVAAQDFLISRNYLYPGRIVQVY